MKTSDRSPGQILPATSHSNACNRGGEKETTRSLRVTVFDARERSRLGSEYRQPSDGMRTAIDARFYKSRSADGAAPVYCSVWVAGRRSVVDGVRHDTLYTSGSGTAKGYGYHKESAAFGAAIESAGIRLPGKLATGLHGGGESAIRDAVECIMRALGYGRCPWMIDG